MDCPIFSTHFFSAKKSSIWRGDVPSSQGMSHIFKKTSGPCLFVPYGNPCSYIGGYRAIDFPGFPFTFSALFRTSGARTWARHDFGHPSLWSLGNFEAKVEESGDLTHIPHGKAMENWWHLGYITYGKLMKSGLTMLNLWKIDEHWELADFFCLNHSWHENGILELEIKGWPFGRLT